MGLKTSLAPKAFRRGRSELQESTGPMKRVGALHDSSITVRTLMHVTVHSAACNKIVTA